MTSTISSICRLGDGTCNSQEYPIEISTSRLLGRKIARLTCFYDCIALTTSGELISWGAGPLLGNLNRTITRNITTMSITSTNAANFKLRANHYSGIVQHGNDMFVFGSNIFGQYGDGSLLSKLTPQRMHAFSKTHVIDFAISRHALILCEGNQLYGFGMNVAFQVKRIQNADRFIIYKERQLINAPTSSNNTAFLNSSVIIDRVGVTSHSSYALVKESIYGSVTGLYIWGQLNTNMLKDPMYLSMNEFFDGHAIIQVSAAKDNLFVWCKGDFLYMILGTDEELLEPQLLKDAKFNSPIKFIGAMSTAQLVVTLDNRVFIRGKIGRSTFQLFTELPSQWQSENITHFTTGDNHAVLVTASIYVYTMGQNTNMKLGVEHSDPYQFPFGRATLFEQQLKLHSAEIIDISASSENTYITYRITNPIWRSILLYIGGSAIGVISILCTIIVIVSLVMRIVSNLRTRYVRPKETELTNKLLRHSITDNININIEKSLFEIPFESLKEMQEIGQGASGSVIFRAKLGKDLVAIKLFNISMISDDDTWHKFETELNFLS